MTIAVGARAEVGLDIGVGASSGVEVGTWVGIGPGAAMVVATGVGARMGALPPAQARAIRAENIRQANSKLAGSLIAIW